MSRGVRGRRTREDYLTVQQIYRGWWMTGLFIAGANAREYEHAYRYWEAPPGNLQDFARGYAETASVQLIVQPPTRIEGAAGSLYVGSPDDTRRASP